jgi:tRNA uridine 5-carboxymethylaminomethyl modification enzyme
VLGVVDDARWEVFCRKRDAVADEIERLKTTWVNPRVIDQAHAQRVLGQELDHDCALVDLLRRPGVTYANLMSLPGAGSAVPDDAVAAQVEVATKYAGYIERQNDEIARRAGQDELRLPADVDYRNVRGLSIEVQQRLNQYRPETIGQASRLPGMTPAAISLLLVHLKRGFELPAARQLSA